MKQLIQVFLITGVLFSCKEQPPKIPELDAPAAEQKFAKFRAGVSDNPELKKNFTVLAKAEAVEQLEVLPADSADKAVAKIKLSDDTIGYVKAKYLAGQPIVFTEDTRAFDRNNETSRVKQTIPKGSIGFILDEKADWRKVYVGQIDGTWVTDEWVNGGYQIDSGLLLDARDFEQARVVLSKKPEEVKEKEKAEAFKTIERLKSSTTLIAQLAEEFSAALEEQNENSLEPASENPANDPITEPAE